MNFASIISDSSCFSTSKSGSEYANRSSVLLSKIKGLDPLSIIFTQPFNKRINFIFGTEFCYCDEHMVLKFCIYSSKVETTDKSVIIESIIDVVNIFGQPDSKFVE